ncbi:MAG: hypothetical protein AAGC85_03820 [Bacteroidota bacterium]
MKKALLLITFSFYASLAFTCRCGGGYGIVKNAYLAPLTIIGEVKRSDNFLVLGLKSLPDTLPESVLKDDFVEINILEVVKGEEKRETIKVYGSNGGNCLARLIPFGFGTKWLIVTGKMVNGEYGLPKCGEYHVQIIDEAVTGNIFYNDECSISEPIEVGLLEVVATIRDSLVNIYPTKSCKEEGIYIVVQEMPSLRDYSDVSSLLAKKLIDIRIHKKFRESTFDYSLIIDENGEVIKAKLLHSRLPRGKRELGNKIRAIISKSKWNAGLQYGIPLKVKIKVSVDLGDILEATGH